MNLAALRPLLAHAAMVFALTIGAWMVFVHPRVMDLREVDATIARNGQLPASPAQTSVEAAVAQLAALRARVADVAARSAWAGDSATLYRSIRDLAEQRGVRVLALTPRATAAVGRSATHQVNQCELTLEGPYGSVAALLETLLDLPGYVRLSSLDLAPEPQAVTRGQDVLSVHVTFETLGFTLPPALAHVRESTHAHQ